MRESEQLEKEAEETRERLAQSLDELRVQVRPDHLIDDFVAYTREGPIADFLSNLATEVRENPLPLLLVTAGLAWLIVSSTLRRQGRVAHVERRETRSERTATGTAVVERDEWAVVPVAE